MRCLIDTEPLPPDFRWVPGEFRRGTEEFYQRTAESLLALGFTAVDVVYDGDHCAVNGVDYHSRESHSWGPPDAYLPCNQADAKPFAPRNVYWNNKYGWRRCDVPDDFDAYVVLSQYHKTVFLAGGLSAERVHVVGHGCDPIPAQAKAPICCYTSSPDRGLGFLQEIWSEVERQTGYRLVASGGTMTTVEVSELYAHSSFALFPGLGVELFCLAALKAQAAGCIPIVVPHMALAETVKFGVKSDIFTYQQTIIDTIRNPPSIPSDYRAPTWLEATEPLAALLRGDS